MKTGYYMVALALCMFWKVAAHAQSKIDSSYSNWYYDARYELYNHLKHHKADIVFLGNSITERGNWAELIPGKIVSNRGIGGDNSFGVLARLEAVTALKPKKLFLMIGVNDLGRGLPVEVILNNYKRIIRHIQTESPRTKIYLQSVLPMNENKLNYDYLKGKNVLVKQLNDGIRLIASEYKLEFINLHEIMADESGELREELTSDGIHLNTVAYKIWVNYLKNKKYL